jgi:pyruvate dehydrogenase E2 component (dihydrolipoamide acetyltransferase)
MADIVNMPKLGFDMAEGTLVRWVINEGEAVQKGAVLAEIETDKATVEVESAYEGVMARHLVAEGDVVPVNTPIAVVAAPGEKVEAGELKVEAKKEEAAPEPQTKKEEAAPASQPKKVEAAPVAQAIPAPAPVSPPEAEGQIPGGIKASPLARRIAGERGIPLNAIKGSGPDGRITKKDVEAYTAAPAAAPAAVAVAPVAAPQAPVPLPSTVLPLNRLRAIIGRRMTEAKQRVPHFYVTHEYDIAALMELRKQVNQTLPEDEKTSVNDYIIKAAALALREFPNLNASLDEGKNQVVQHGQVNIGVAVAVEGGLLTVVSRDTDRKPLRQIAAELRPMLQRAREGKVRPDDIEGSTFSVSNLGMYDVEHFIAIINPPEAAILAIGSVQEVPVVKDGQVVPGLRMKATISVDHRVSDGAEAARFMQALVKYLEEPLRLLV